MSGAIDHIRPWTVADVLALSEDRTVRYELLGEGVEEHQCQIVR
ncbi:hypothetical protein N566_26815 [Streptomycetaceae bacterium MP113-05]|nr:hypothetical protein N566_26815 [Streptomycetaceae bacterium MP113-05]